MDFEAISKQAYKITHETAPPDVPRWEDLHSVERDYLIKFAEAVWEITP